MCSITLGVGYFKFSKILKEYIFIAIKDEKLIFDTVFTSILKRANDTADIIVDELDPKPQKVVRHWRLNERHYGALTGLNKAEMAEIHGKTQVHTQYTLE